MRRGVSLTALGLAVALSGCEEPVPKTPTFSVEVRPIFEAHCVRCHGAGGTLNEDPRALEDAPPTGGFLNQYEDEGDCTPNAMGYTPVTCQRGARYEAEIGNIKAFLHGPVTPRMPLAPSPPLDSWELAVVDNWLAESPPLP